MLWQMYREYVLLDDTLLKTTSYSHTHTSHMIIIHFAREVPLVETKNPHYAEV